MEKLWIVALLLASVLLYFLSIILIPNEKANELPKDEVKACQIEITVIGLDEPVLLEEYVKGVVAAEMPMTFHDEALKAQAIAARTYALRLTELGKQAIAADVSAQVYATKEMRKERWGKEFSRNEKRLTALVKATESETIVHGEEMISAMFFSTSNGKTENAQNYGGSTVPYLQSVESPGEEEVNPLFERIEELTLAEWNAALGTEWNTHMFKSLQLVRNSTGRVQKVISSGFELTGREMRELLGLASTDFDIAFDIANNIVQVQTTGYGHGVGMSQYGAEVYAQEGWVANKILQHYYSGTIIKKFTPLDSECLKSP